MKIVTVLSLSCYKKIDLKEERFTLAQNFRVLSIVIWKERQTDMQTDEALPPNNLFSYESIGGLTP